MDVIRFSFDDSMKVHTTKKLKKYEQHFETSVFLGLSAGRGKTKGVV
jgi:hypothetical protein